MGEVCSVPKPLKYQHQKSLITDHSSDNNEKVWNTVKLPMWHSRKVRKYSWKNGTDKTCSIVGLPQTSQFKKNKKTVSAKHNKVKLNERSLSRLQFCSSSKAVHRQFLMNVCGCVPLKLYSWTIGRLVQRTGISLLNSVLDVVLSDMSFTEFF